MYLNRTIYVYEYYSSPNNTFLLRPRGMFGIPVEDSSGACLLICSLGDILYQVTVCHYWWHLHKPACVRCRRLSWVHIYFVLQLML